VFYDSKWKSEFFPSTDLILYDFKSVLCFCQSLVLNIPTNQLTKALLAIISTCKLANLTSDLTTQSKMKWNAVILRGFALFCSVDFASFHTTGAPQPFVHTHNIKCKEWFYTVIFLPEESKCIQKKCSLKLGTERGIYFTCDLVLCISAL
jgi:hypothetical protein